MTYYKCGSVYTTQNSNVVVDTASGAIANFETDIALPLKSLEIDVNAVQESGTPTPSDPKAISGWNDISAIHCGKNLLDTSKTFQQSSNAVVIGQNRTYARQDVFVKKGSYAIRVNTSIAASVYYREEIGSNIRIGATNTDLTFSLDEDKWLAFYVYTSAGITISDVSGFQLEFGLTTSKFEPYNSNNYEIVFPPKSEIAPYFEGLLSGTCDFVDLGSLVWSLTAGTRFAASEISSVIKIPENTSIKANMIVSTIYTVETAGHVVGDATLYDRCIAISSFNGNIFITNSAYSDATAFGNSLNGIYLIYELATPKTPTITPEQLATLKKAFAATYYGGHFTQDKDGRRQFEVTHGVKIFRELDFEYSNNSGKWESYRFFALIDKLRGKNVKCSNYEAFSPTSAGAVMDNETLIAPTGNDYVYIRDDNYTTKEAFITANTNTQLWYELAEPFTIDLPDGTPIKSLPGVNNIYTDTGDTSLQFRKIG